MVIGGEWRDERGESIKWSLASTEPPMVIGGETRRAIHRWPHSRASTEPPMVIGGEPPPMTEAIEGGARFNGAADGDRRRGAQWIRIPAVHLSASTEPPMVIGGEESILKLHVYRFVGLQRSRRW